MVKDRVQHHPDTPAVGGLDQLFQVLIGSELGVYPLVVGDVIFVIAVRAEDRGQVDAPHAQLLQVIQLFGNPLQIAARKILRGGLSAPGHCDVGIVLYPVSPIKTVYKDLVKYRVLHPLYHRHDVVGVDVGQLKEIVEAELEVIGLRQTVLAKPAYPISLLQAEDIGQPDVCQRQLFFIVVVQPVGITDLHLCLPLPVLIAIFFAIYQKHPNCLIFLCRAEPKDDFPLAYRKAESGIRDM